MVNEISFTERDRLVSGLKNIPFLRVLIPFLLGVVFCFIWHFNANVLIALLGVFVVIFLLYLNNRSKYGVQQNTVLFMFVCDIFLFLAAIQCCYLNDIRNNENYYGHYLTSEKIIWTGKILELPVEKQNSYKTVVEVKGLKDVSVDGKTIVYIKKPFDRSMLEPGTLITVNSTFLEVPKPLNPHEFNYKEFLAARNIRYTSFAGAEDILVCGTELGFSLVNFGSAIRQKIIDAFNSPGLNKEAAQLSAALLTGYDNEISPETINAFAHSGTLHVLSVSGLHTGILYAVIIFILTWLDPHGKYKLFQLVVITCILWLFVLITGFSPPVLRAAIMLNLIAIGRSYYNYTPVNALNILSVSAFIILVFDPMLIADAGFLLSYSAVAGILLFEPYITNLVDSRSWLVNKVWQLTSVSLAAQLSTLPVTLFLFHQFPLWFIFTNLIVIPLCIAVMALAFLFLLKMTFIAPLINLCSSFIFFIIHLTDVPGIGYIDQIDFGRTDLLFLSFFIIASALFLSRNSYAYAVAALSLLVVWQISSLVEVGFKRSSSHIAVYQVRKQTAVDLKNAAQLYFCNEITSGNYNYHIRNNHAWLNPSEENELEFDYAVSSNTRFFSLSSPDHGRLIKFLRPDYILVKKNQELPEEILKDVKPKLIIADGSNNYRGIKKLKALCDKFAIPFHSTANNGYLQIEL